MPDDFYYDDKNENENENDKKISINLSRLFPEAARRVRILNDLKKSWAGVVGLALARHSVPYNLGVSEIHVAADSQKTASMLINMKGNIIRVLTSRYDYHCSNEFNLKITTGVPALRKIPDKNKKEILKNPASEIKIDDETMKKYMSGAPATLPKDINYAISHLMAFFEKRFPSD